MRKLKNSLTEEELLKIQLLRAQDLSVHEIARQIGRSHGTVHTHLKRFKNYKRKERSVKRQTGLQAINMNAALSANFLSAAGKMPASVGFGPMHHCFGLMQRGSEIQLNKIVDVNQRPNQPPFQSIREPEVNIYAEEEKMTPRPDSSLLEEQSFTLDSVQENGEDTFHEPEIRHKKSKKISGKKKLKKSSTIQATLDSLKTVTKAITTQHDEFSLFGEYMAMSLRTMPMRNALKCKEKLLSVIVNERLSLNSDTS